FRQQAAFLRTAGSDLFRLRTRQFLADGGKTQPALVQNLGRKTLFFAQQAQQQVLGTDMLVAETLGLFGAISQYPLALVAERQIDRGGNLVANRGVPFDLLANGFNSTMTPKQAIPYP